MGCADKKRGDAMPRVKTKTRHANAGPATAMRWRQRLADGTPVTIRGIRKQDAVFERAFLQRLSEESRHNRFVTLVRSPVNGTLDRLTDIDFPNEIGFIALIDDERGEIEIGTGMYRSDPNGESCHCAVAIDDQWRRRGLGTLLMGHLIDAARANGKRRMYAAGAVACEKSHRLASRLGFRRVPDPEDPAAVIYELEL